MIHLSIQTLSTIFNNRAIDSSRTRGLISNSCDESIMSRPSEKNRRPFKLLHNRTEINVLGSININ